jgi:putative tryptophan/tyrosine transport system substrate-binding protein
LGLVASLNRPGANLTGIANFTVELAPKRLQLLRELLPNAALFGVLAGADLDRINALLRKSCEGRFEIAIGSGIHNNELQAQRARRRLQVCDVGLDTRKGRVRYSRRMDQLAALMARHALPAISQYREFVLAGGLISYGSSLNEESRLVGGYAGRILMGEKPADLPVQQVTKIELVINLKTAKALGLTIPETLLATADEVIQ